jgi:hypothetical protein
MQAMRVREKLVTKYKTTHHQITNDQAVLCRTFSMKLRSSSEAKRRSPAHEISRFFMESKDSFPSFQQPTSAPCLEQDGSTSSISVRSVLMLY